MVYGLNIQMPGYYNYGSDVIDGPEIHDRKVKLLDNTPDGGADLYGLYAGRHIDATMMPKKMKWGGGRVKIPDFNQHACIDVSERAKDLIERFEPGAHQFIPVDFYNGKGVLLQHRYFLVCGARIDSLDHDKTTFVLKQYPGEPELKRWVTIDNLVRWNETDQIPQRLSPATKSKLVFSERQIGNHHMWQDKYLGGTGYWCSDELAHALKKSDLTGLELSKDGMETVA